MTAVDLTSALRCPVCGHAERLAMPTDACGFFHECTGCRAQLRPKPGDCCVFCSYGSVPCPTVQAGSQPDSQMSSGDCCPSPCRAPDDRAKLPARPAP